MTDEELQERLSMLEKATAVAYLDAIAQRTRYMAEAAKVTLGEKQGRNYRLVIAPTPSGGVHATIEIAEIGRPPGRYT